jgi:hypothetical protein
MEIEIRAHDLYIEGLKQIMKSKNVGLEEATRIAREDAIKTKGDEQLPYIEAAYNYLRSVDKK